MKLKIISIEPDYASFPAVSVAAKAGVIFNPKHIVIYQILGVEGTTTPIGGKIYTDKNEAHQLLQEVREDAIHKIEQFNCRNLPGKEFKLTPREEIVGKEFEFEDNR